MAPVPVNAYDEALASGQWSKWIVIEPIGPFRAVCETLGKKETNYLIIEKFDTNQPIIMQVWDESLVAHDMGRNRAFDAWTTKSLFAPVKATTLGIVRNVQRLIDGKLDKKMPGLEAMSSHGVKEWEVVYEKVLNGKVDKAIEALVLQRKDLDAAARDKIKERLGPNSELAWTSFTGEDYDESVLDARVPVTKGKEHALDIPGLINYLRRVSLSIEATKPKMSKAALALVDKLPKTSKAWRAIAEQELSEIDKVKNLARDLGGPVASGSGTAPRKSKGTPGEASAANNKYGVGIGGGEDEKQVKKKKGSAAGGAGENKPEVRGNKKVTTNAAAGGSGSSSQKRKIDLIDILTDSDEEKVSAKKARLASTSGSKATNTTGNTGVGKNAPGGAGSVKDGARPLATNSNANVDDQLIDHELAALLFPPDDDHSS